MSRFGEDLIESSKEALIIVYKDRIKLLERELAAEKALADRFDDLNTRAIMGVGWSKTDALELMEAYHKARGL